MSIEQNLERIAVALEQLVKSKCGTPVPAVEPPVVTKKGLASKKEALAAAAPETEEATDMFASETQAEPLVTLEKLSDTLKLHAKALGTKLTIALIKKHGADSTTPKINTIPTANWFVCFAEAEADLKKTKKV